MIFIHPDIFRFRDSSASPLKEKISVSEAERKISGILENLGTEIGESHRTYMGQSQKKEEEILKIIRSSKKSS